MKPECSELAVWFDARGNGFFWWRNFYDWQSHSVKKESSYKTHSGHVDSEKMKNQFLAIFFWTGMTAEIEECDICLCVRFSRQTKRGLLITAADKSAAPLVSNLLPFGIRQNFYMGEWWLTWTYKTTCHTFWPTSKIMNFIRYLDCLTYIVCLCLSNKWSFWCNLISRICRPMSLYPFVYSLISIKNTICNFLLYFINNCVLPKSKSFNKINSKNFSVIFTFLNLKRQKTEWHIK